MEEQIVNRVANSKLVSLDLEDFFVRDNKMTYDIADQLYKGLILREKDFRQHVKENDWSQYEGKFVAITCTADAIVPTWAYMLVAANITPYASELIFGTAEELDRFLIAQKLRQIDPAKFQDAKVVIKGCGDLDLSAYAYVEAVKILQPVCTSIMYGEPCSTVPVYKKKKPQN